MPSIEPGDRVIAIETIPSGFRSTLPMGTAGTVTHVETCFIAGTIIYVTFEGNVRTTACEWEILPI